MELALNRDLLHSQFSSWRLQPIATVKRHELEIYGHAAGIISSSVDFLHTQASVTRNHVLQSEGRLFVFTQQDGAAAHRIFELLPVPGADAGLLPVQVAELAGTTCEAAVGGPVEAVLDCSLAVVAPHAAATPLHLSQQQPSQGQEQGQGQGQQQQQQYESAQPFQMLVSRGHGDLVLVRVPAGGGAAVTSSPVFPVRPRAPLAGVRPVTLEAAVEHANGDITAIAWAIRSRGASTPGCCELFAVTLRPVGASGAEGEGQGQLRLETVGVQLLLRTKLAPYVVRVYAAAAAAAAGGGGGAAAGADGGVAPVAVVGFDPNTAGLEEEDDEDHEPQAGASGRPSVAAMEAAAAADDAANAPPANAGGGGGGGGDDDDMDPRTLEQAAARLAHLTSSERDKAAPLAQWADIYKESGPDGVGAMGSEPVVDLAAWRLGGEAGGSTDKIQRPYWRMSCHAHRLLTSDGPLMAPVPVAAAAQPALLLGVTDDVDCAVVRLDLPKPPHAAAGAPQSTHAISIPALAYVAAGKTYKRHLLLGSAGTGCSSASSSSGGVLSAVLVESQRFMYMYGFTSSKEEYGRQQVVELGLGEGESVLGARLVELAAAGAGAEAGGALVVVATQRRLLSYRLVWR
ncbi:hypothetical protein HYH02_012590 [Chlamydomonas schloesseri]|uniref:Uncharacterized protein n=1 Tax=Chlamydomonas schloesseri TaxID=2026947 RepID=A0A835SXV3_9CHLO|nr:hypothetical protein HYH02_012590 [Chlamydomonas schloesseri]|eukprot:KAG2433472.1 hypothetical protein HYH02_012590 [Chlamydomonas schloesseri]